MDYLMGIDIGTTNIKAMIFDAKGNEISGAIAPTPVTMLEEESAFYDPDALWSTLCCVLNSTLGGLDKKNSPAARADIKGIAVASMAESGLPLDASGKPLYSIVSWFDVRTKKYLDYWKESSEKVFRITGQRFQHIFTVNKMMWLQENEPEIYAKTKKWLGVAGYINFMLTGETSMDYSLATRTMMLDIRKGTWSDDILEKAGIDPQILPPLVHSGTCIGKVTRMASEQTGLNEGTPVFAGGHDHVCSALAAGATEEGVFMDSSGTAEPVLTTRGDVERLFEFAGMGFSTGYHVSKGKYYLYGSITSSGATVDWYQKEFLDVLADESTRMAGARGLLFLPHLRGSSSPTRNPVSKASFVGIRAFHTRTDFSQAVYEGLSFELKQIIEMLTDSKDIRRIISVGGGTKNSIWTQTKANILEKPIEIPAVQEGTAMGAALLAGIGTGIYNDEKDAVSQTYRIGRTVEPQLNDKELYRDLYEIYKKLFNALLEVNCDLERVMNK